VPVRKIKYSIFFHYFKIKTLGHDMIYSGFVFVFKKGTGSVISLFFRHFG